MTKLELSKVMHHIMEVINEELGKSTSEFDYDDCSYIFDFDLSTTPEEIHEKWMDKKLEDGWIYGEIKDEVEKTHPCIVPYEELPMSEKIKDLVALGIFRYHFITLSDTLSNKKHFGITTLIRNTKNETR